jgi:hypothetical protein
MYRFSEPLGGKYGEMPCVEIGGNENIPPLDKVHSLYIDFCRKDKLAESDIVVTWIVDNTGAILKLYCGADDSRLLEQYKNNAALGEKVIELLLLPEQRGIFDRRYRLYEPGFTISKTEIPESLQPFVASIEAWKAFFEKSAVSGLSGRHYVQITDDGYYMAPITGSCLRLGRSPDPMNEDLEEGFDFDPKTNPPIVSEHGICWKLPEAKIMIALPHEVSSGRVASYYEYLEVWQNFMSAQRKFEGDVRVASQRNEAEDEEKRRQEEAKLRQVFLHA